MSRKSELELAESGYKTCRVKQPWLQNKNHRNISREIA